VKKFLLAIEPLIWGPFVTGNFLTPLFFPALILALGIAWPLGLVPAEALAYERVHGIATNPVFVIGVLVLLPLALLAGSHHLRHAVIDAGGGEHDTRTAPLLYGLWQVGAIATALALVRLFVD
jgi:fumarate reductase subunit D